MDSVGAGRHRTAAQVDVIVLPDGKDGLAGGVRLRDRGDPLVGPRGQIHDDAIDIGEDGVEPCGGPDGDRDGVGRPDQVGQAGPPDQVVGKDRDTGRQSSVSAR